MPITAKLDEFGKPAWIALIVLGFWAFWPLGLAILAFTVWSGRMGCGYHGHDRWQHKMDRLQRKMDWVRSRMGRSVEWRRVKRSRLAGTVERQPRLRRISQRNLAAA